MLRSIAWLAGSAALALISNLSAHHASAQINAQVCVEDQYGRIVCGRQVDPNRVDLNRGAPRYQNPPGPPNYGPPRGRETAAPPDREFGPPPAERGYGPPPAHESAAPPARDFPPPPPGREYRPERGGGPPPGREYGPPPPLERDPGRDPRNVDPRNPDSRNLDPRNDPRNLDPRLGRPYQNSEPRYQPPMSGPNGQMICPRDFFIQDGLCTPYIRR